MADLKLPVYYLDINDDLTDDAEVNYVALVDRPAIEKCWQKFKQAPAAFIANEDKQIISGPLMIADMPIYRRDEEFGEYYAMFNAQAIEKIAKKYFAKGFQNNVNLMHADGMKVDGLTMFESWIVDRDKGKMPMLGYEDVSCGSWFGSFSVTNPTVWQMVKDELIKGFSVEGLFNYKKKKKDKHEAILEQVEFLLKQIED